MKKPLRRFFAIKEALFDLEFIKVCVGVFYATGGGEREQQCRRLPKKLPKNY
jgi:hypothetical protein